MRDGRHALQATRGLLRRATRPLRVERYDVAGDVTPTSLNLADDATDESDVTARNRERERGFERIVRRRCRPAKIRIVGRKRLLFPAKIRI